MNRKKYRVNPLYRFKILKRLSEKKFKIALNVSVDRGMMSDEISTNCNSQKIITIEKETHFLSSYFAKINNGKYSEIISLNSFNEYEKLEELKNILIKYYNIAFITAFYSKKNSKVERYAVIAPFASKKNQSWPLQNFLILTRQLKESIKIIVVGQNIVKRNNSNEELPQGVINLVSKTTLKKVIEIISNSTLFIGNDSGLTHLAYLMNVPIIVLVGGGNFGQFFPSSSDSKNIFHYHSIECFNCRWKCIQSEPFCLTRVSVESVYNSAIKLLNR